MSEIHTAAGLDTQCRNIISSADNYFNQKKSEIAEKKSLALLDALVTQMWSYKDDTLDRIEIAKKPVEVTPPVVPPKPQPKKRIKNVYRQAIFKADTLESQADVDAYVERIRSYLTALLTDCDGIKLN